MAVSRKLPDEMALWLSVILEPWLERLAEQLPTPAEL